MKRMAILAGVVVTGLAAVLTTGAVTAQGLPGITGIEQVSGNVYKIFGAGGNTTVFVREHDVVLVDTKLPGNGEAILAEVRKVTDKPVGMIINTHSHPDHTGSNAELAPNGDVQVVAQVNSAARMRAGGGPFPPLRVDSDFEARKTIGEGDDRIELYFFGAGHTDGDAFVVFPAARTMAAGDLYAWHMSPLIDPGSGGSILALPSTLAGAVYGIDGVDKVIQGHGGVSTWAEFHSFMNFNRGLVATAEQTLLTGGTPEDALKKLEATPSYAVFLDHKLKPGLEYGGTPWSRALINLTLAFQELRGEKPELIMGMEDPHQH
ncbi:MBL fold metallo-hydrolase [Aurantiacibacter xanthus]|uniref:MBL fold metallo-hydrolase n=1 Tax=Aurantiacibacter xanthus TaxID=1784712 RepID=A0A3A1P2V1_9SPHN|nr:MBL fold metallo-hydrolase [Aurantiacibacter xanthus]RIV84762.1 MBL fold metallo-hydrolase [Aurantiacibacter xanthus]